MPEFTLTVTVSTRVANLVRDAAARERSQTADPDSAPVLSPRDFFVKRVRQLAVRIAEVEFSFQEEEADRPRRESINDEVTV